MKIDQSIEIAAKIDEHEIVIIEEIIRRVLKLNNDNGIEKFNQDCMIKRYQRMGYPEDRTRKSIKKTLLAGPWRFILNMAIHCMGSRKGGFNEANLTLASGVLTFT